MDDQLIINAEQLQTLIKGKPGDDVSLTYYRQGMNTRPRWLRAQ